MSSNRPGTMLIVVQVLVGLLLSYAAVTKAMNIPMFAFVIQSAVPFAGNASTPTLVMMAQGVMFVEILIGVSLVVHFYSRVMRSIAILMFVVFSGLLLMLLTEENPVSCGCLGISPDGMGSHAELVFGLVRNAFLIAMLVTVSMRSKHEGDQGESQRMQSAQSGFYAC